MEGHLINDFEISPTVEHSAPYVKRRESRVIGLCGSYIDDSLNAGGDEF